MRTIDIDLQSNLVTIRPDPDRELDLAAIPTAIDEAGFRPGQLHLRARGTLEGDDRDCFRIRGWSRCFPVQGDFARDSTSELALTADLEVRGELFALVRARAAN